MQNNMREFYLIFPLGSLSVVNLCVVGTCVISKVDRQVKYMLAILRVHQERWTQAGTAFWRCLRGPERLFLSCP